MNKLVKFSEIPVGEKFEYKGKVYIRSSYCRGKKEDKTFLRFPKHRIVSWINAWPNNIEA
jgi:hypothetical protein